MRPVYEIPIVFNGTFFNDKLEGIVACKIAYFERTLAGEVKNGVLFGKMTFNRRGNLMNFLMEGPESEIKWKCNEV